MQVESISGMWEGSLLLIVFVLLCPGDELFDLIHLLL